MRPQTPKHPSSTPAVRTYLALALAAAATLFVATGALGARGGGAEAAASAAGTPSTTKSPLTVSTAFTAQADAYVQSDTPNTHYGAANVLTVDNGLPRRSYLLFNVQGVSGSVQRATLSLDVYYGPGIPVTVSTVPDTSWGEYTITWGNMPALGAKLSSLTTPSVGSRVSVDVTSAVAGNGLVSIALTTTSKSRTKFYSRENGTSYAPTLTVETDSSSAATAPASTAAPTLSGTAQSGQTLTSTTGSWSGTAPISYAYQWQRCDSTGAGCSSISGATASSYTLGSGDVGQTVLAQVTASNSAGVASASTAPSAVVLAAPAAVVPANTALPTLSGTAQSGQTLTSATGSWSGTAPLSYAYQWQRCDSAGANCAAISGATAASFTLGSADVGSTVRSAVTASNSAGSASATSAQSAVVQAASTSPPPTPNSRFGISAMTTNLSSDSDADFARDMDTIKSSGAQWIRLDINWGVIQRGGPTSYDWAATDRIVNGARARGLSVLGIIDWTPGWANSGNAHAPPTNLSDYANFASVAVKRYAPQGVHAYEVWNEENLGYNWGGKADAAGYVQMLKAAYPVIHAADPQATVVSGGMSPATDNGTDSDPRTFVQAMYANGVKGYFDALGHHPYCYPAAPGDAQNWSSWYQMYGPSNSLRATMVANGDGDKKIWATEFGYPTNGPSGTFVSEATQATWITLAYQLFGSYSWAGPLFVWSSRDAGTSTSTRYNFYGLLRYDFSAKPAFAAFQAAAAAG